MVIPSRLGVLANFLPLPVKRAGSGVGTMRLTAWIKRSVTPRSSSGSW